MMKLKELREPLNTTTNRIIVGVLAGGFVFALVVALAQFIHEQELVCSPWSCVRSAGSSRSADPRRLLGHWAEYMPANSMLKFPLPSSVRDQQWQHDFPWWYVFSGLVSCCSRACCASTCA